MKRNNNKYLRFEFTNRNQRIENVNWTAKDTNTSSCMHNLPIQIHSFYIFILIIIS